eukprot:bmy_03011T0
MGSFVSQPLEPVKDVAPPEVASSANPAPVIAPGAPTSPAEAPLFNNCWSCRVLSGSGLIGAGGYVYWVARKPMKLGYPPGPGTIAQMVFGIMYSKICFDFCWCLTCIINHFAVSRITTHFSKGKDAIRFSPTEFSLISLNKKNHITPLSGKTLRVKNVESRTLLARAEPCELHKT